MSRINPHSVALATPLRRDLFGAREEFHRNARTCSRWVIAYDNSIQNLLRIPELLEYRVYRHRENNSLTLLIVQRGMRGPYQVSNYNHNPLIRCTAITNCNFSQVADWFESNSYLQNELVYDRI